MREYLNQLMLRIGWRAVLGSVLGLSPALAWADGEGAVYLAIWAVMFFPTIVSVALVGTGRRLIWLVFSVLVCALSATIILGGYNEFLGQLAFVLPMLLMPTAFWVNRIMNKLKVLSNANDPESSSSE